MRTELGARFVRSIRMAIYGAAVSVAVSLVGARRVHADVTETSRATSSLLAHLSEMPELADGLTRLWVNGAGVHVAAAVVHRPLEDVVKALEASCHADVPGLAVPAPIARAITTKDSGSTKVLCLADSAQTYGRPLADRLVDFAASHDVADLGSLRHFVVMAVPDGARVIAAWLPGRFPLDRVFPSEGDAPGSDASDVPRPEGSRRVLLARAEGHPYVARIYEVRGASERDVAARYAAALAQRGWFPHDGAKTIYALGDRDLLVQVRADAGLDSVFVSTIEMPAPGPAK